MIGDYSCAWCPEEAVEGGLCVKHAASNDPGLGPNEVRCNGCSEALPDVLLCAHDEHATGPLCPGCCELEHPHQCRRCFGLGRVSDFSRPHHEALGLYRECPTCGGRGHVNQETAA